MRRFYVFSSMFLALMLAAVSLQPLALAASPPDPAQKDFFKAVGKGDLERVRELIAQGADVNMSISGMPVIMAAPDPAMINFLAQSGADVNARSDLLNMTVLVSFISKGKVDVVKALIQAGADVNTRDSKTGATALSSAIKPGKVDIIRTLIEAGADVNGVGFLGMRPLSLAVMAGKLNIVDILIESGADVEAKDEDGTSPLMRAVSMRKTKIAKVLIEAGADVNAPASSRGSKGKRSKGGGTAMDMASLTGDDELKEALKKAGAKKIKGAPEPDDTKANPGGIYTLECDLTGSPPPQGAEFSCSDIDQIAASGVEETIFSSAYFEGEHSVPKKKGCEVDLGQPGSYTIRTVRTQSEWSLVCRTRLGTTTGNTKWIANIERKKPKIIQTEKTIVISGPPKKESIEEKEPPSIKIVTPLKDEQFTFAKGDPGKLQIDAEAEVKGDCDADASWKMEEISGSKQKFDPETASNAVRIRFEGLPGNTSQLGKKKITASACGKSDSVVVELFFPPEASNHPGAGNGTTPNWFFYWRQTKAGKGYRPAYTPEKIATDGSRAIGQYDYTADKVFLTDQIMQKSCAPRAKALGGKESKGIDCFAETARHETQHQKERWEWWGTTNPQVLSFFERHKLDFDGDLVPDDVEKELARKNCSKWDPTSCDGRPRDSLLDIEMNAYWIGWEWPVGSADSEDWSWCGRQWSDVSVCPGNKQW